MLEHWLSPVNPEQIVEAELQPWQLGARIRLHTESGLPGLRGVRVALIGVGAADADAARKALYPMAFPFEGLKIADLGNIRNNNLSFIIPAIAELLNSRILPVLIGNDLYFGLSLFKAARQVLENINLVVVDEKIRFHPGAQQDPNPILYEVLDDPGHPLFHLGVIGFQGHFTAPDTLREMEQRCFDLVRLGYARANLSETEPVIRDADLLWFHAAALKQSEMPAQSTPSPSGFTIEEACQGIWLFRFPVGVRSAATWRTSRRTDDLVFPGWFSWPSQRFPGFARRLGRIHCGVETVRLYAHVLEKPEDRALVDTGARRNLPKKPTAPAHPLFLQRL
jgi:hypothetical protein